jgi:hypothetical protein
MWMTKKMKPYQRQAPLSSLTNSIGDTISKYLNCVDKRKMKCVNKILSKDTMYNSNHYVDEESCHNGCFYCGHIINHSPVNNFKGYVLDSNGIVTDKKVDSCDRGAFHGILYDYHQVSDDNYHPALIKDRKTFCSLTCCYSMWAPIMEEHQNHFISVSTIITKKKVLYRSRNLESMIEREEYISNMQTMEEYVRSISTPWDEDETIPRIEVENGRNLQMEMQCIYVISFNHQKLKRERFMYSNNVDMEAENYKSFAVWSDYFMIAHRPKLTTTITKLIMYNPYFLYRHRYMENNMSSYINIA